MSCIALISLGWQGHVNPIAALAEELVRGGAEVTFFTTKEHEALVRRTGARFEAYESSMTPAAMVGATPSETVARVPLRILEEAAHVLPQIMDRMRALGADLVVYDSMALAGRFAAESLGVRKAIARTTYAANKSFSVARMAPPVADDHPLRLALRSCMTSLVTDHGIRPFAPPEIFHTPGTLTVVFIPRAFHPHAEEFDDRYVFVGPQIDGASAAAPRREVSARPFVFVSLGTLFNDWEGFFRMGIDVLAARGVDAVIACGDRVDRAALGTVPSNIQLETSVPQLELLARADLFVTHAGMNSAMEGLAFGVPMLAIPQMLEQAQTAVRLEALDFGRALLGRVFPEHGDVTAVTLGSAVDDLLADGGRRRERIRAFGPALREGGGRRRAAELLLAEATASA